MDWNTLDWREVLQKEFGVLVEGNVEPCRAEHIFES